MTASNPNPLANPLNDRPFGNVNFGKMAAGFYINRGAGGNPKNLTLPESKPVDFNALAEKQSGLTVPNQDVPLGDQLRGNGFLNDNVMRLSDGSVVDFKNRKVFEVPSVPGYWGNPNASIGHGYVDGMSWNGNERKADGQSQIVDDAKSAEYWRNAEIESEKLKTEMTDAQKAEIAEFESHFPKSRLIDESKNIQKQNLTKEN